jgi:hypothetical protein
MQQIQFKPAVQKPFRKILVQQGDLASWPAQPASNKAAFNSVQHNDDFHTQLNTMLCPMAATTVVLEKVH